MEVKNCITTTSCPCSATAIGSNFTGDEKAVSRNEQGSDDNAKTECEFVYCGTGLQTAATDDSKDRPKDTKDMEIEMNEDGCCTVKVAVPQLIRNRRRDSRSCQENSEAGEHSLSIQLKSRELDNNKENEVIEKCERERDFVISMNQIGISCQQVDTGYQEIERGSEEKRGSSEMNVEPIQILNLPEEPTVRHVYHIKTQKDCNPTHKGEMETSFYYSGLGILTDQREGTIQDGVICSMAKSKSAQFSLEKDFGKPIEMDNIKGNDNASPGMSREKEQKSELNFFVDSSRELYLSKYPKKKVTLKMTKKVEEFNKTMIDEDDFLIGPSGITMNSKNALESNLKVKSDIETASIEVTPADYSRRRSKIESFGAKSKQFKSIGQCEFCALHLEKVLKGDFLRPQNEDKSNIRTRSSEIVTYDQQMRREKFYLYPQRSVGDVIYQDVYNEERNEHRPRNSVHTIMIGGSSKSKQYFQTYSSEYVPASRSIDVPDLPPIFNPSRRRTIEDLKNFSITIPVRIKKQPSQDSAGQKSLTTGRELRYSVSQKHSASSTRIKSKTRDRNSSIHRREGHPNSGVGRKRKATLSTRELPAGTYTSPEDPAALDLLLMESKPANYLWLALCTTIFFNPIFGIVALILSSKFLHLLHFSQHLNFTF